MRDYKRLAAGAALSNHPDGLIQASISDYDGGPFGLVPKISEEGLFLAATNRPSGYGLQITGEPEALKRLANALNTLARQLQGDSSDEE